MRTEPKAKTQVKNNSRLRRTEKRLDLDSMKRIFPPEEVNQLSAKIELSYEDCINLVVFRYFCELKDSMPDLFTGGEA